jgi:hypothetical protein
MQYSMRKQLASVRLYGLERTKKSKAPMDQVPPLPELLRPAIRADKLSIKACCVQISFEDTHDLAGFTVRSR